MGVSAIEHLCIARYLALSRLAYLAIHKCSMGVSAIDYDFGCTYWKSKDTK